MSLRRRGGARRATAAGALGLCVVVTVVLGAAGPIGAQGEVDPGDSGTPEQSDKLRVEQLDARRDRWVLEGTASAPPVIEVDGEPVEADVRTGIGTDVVIVIDNDRSLPNGNLQLAKDAAATLVPGSSGIRRVAVVSTAREGAAQEVSWSTSPEVVADAIEGIEPTGDAATWDALGRGAALLESSDATSKRVVAFLAAPDKLSNARPTMVERDLRLTGGNLDAIVLPRGVDTTTLSNLVGQLGGSIATASSDEALDDLAATTARNLEGQFVAEVPAPEGDLPVLEVSAGSATQLVEAHPGDLQVGANQLAVSDTSQSLLGQLTSNAALHWLAVLLLVLAVGGAAWAVMSLVVPDENSLARRLSVYEEADVAALGDEGAPQTMATVPILQRAVALTGDMAEKRGLLESVEVSLERANLPLRAAEAMFFVGLAALLLGAVSFLLTRNLLVALAVAVFAVLVPKGLLDMRVRLRQKKFVAQLPDMLSLLAGTLKAGYSITQGFEAVSREIEDPMGRELRRVVTEHRLGRTLEDALDATAERMGSDDFEWTVMAIKIQREVGGNLAELLLTVANTMTERERLRREVATLTAEGRISAIILGLLPPGLAAVMFVMNREYIQSLFTPGFGYAMVVASVIAMVVGFLWMKKIITIEA